MGCDLKEIYWAAGFLEGEGYFAKAGSHNNSPQVDAAQVNIEPLLRMRDIFGGKILGPYFTPRKDKAKAQPVFKWRAGGSRAVGIVLTVYSLMSEKRQKAIISMMNAWKQQPMGSRNWAELGRCRKGHEFKGENHAFDVNTGKYRCRQCSIEYKRRYYAENAEKWKIIYGKKAV